MVEFNTETMKTFIINTVDMTVIPKGEDFEYVRPVKLHNVFSEVELDSHALAYEVFKSALYVVQQQCIPVGGGFMYEVKCTYAAPDEEFEIMAYGLDDDLDY